MASCHGTNRIKSVALEIHRMNRAGMITTTVIRTSSIINCSITSMAMNVRKTTMMAMTTPATTPSAPPPMPATV
jgi:hypothetical protein